MNPEKLTAYALGELPPEEARAVERELERNPALAREVAAIRGVASALERGFEREPKARLTPEQRASVAEGRTSHFAGLRAFWESLTRNKLVPALAAAVVICFGVMLELKQSGDLEMKAPAGMSRLAAKMEAAEPAPMAAAPTADAPMAAAQLDAGPTAPAEVSPVQAAKKAAPMASAREGRANTGMMAEKAETAPAAAPLSRAQVAAKKLAMVLAKGSIGGGGVTTRGSVLITQVPELAGGFVRVASMPVAIFATTYPPGSAGALVDHFARAHDGPAGFEVGPAPWSPDHRLIRLSFKPVKIEFGPAVSAYRQIGSLYEIILASPGAAPTASELAKVTLSDGALTTITDSQAIWSATTAEFKFLSAVAAFGLGTASSDQVLSWAPSTADDHRYTEFAALVRARKGP
jgi:hypothetical protein